jgi:hypothetical protein
LLEPELPHKTKRQRVATLNGDIKNPAVLCMALRYFARGDPLDILEVFKVNCSIVYLLTIKHLFNGGISILLVGIIVLL